MVPALAIKRADAYRVPEWQTPPDHQLPMECHSAALCGGTCTTTCAAGALPLTPVYCTLKPSSSAKSHESLGRVYVPKGGSCPPLARAAMAAPGTASTMVHMFPPACC